MKVFDIAVIGGGSAGPMAVQRAILNNNECLFFPGSPKNKKQSRAFWVTKVENMPAHFHYKKGITDPNKETIDWILNSPFKEKLHLMNNLGVESLHKNEDGIFEIIDNKKNNYLAKFIILCTGVMDVQPKIQGSIEPIFPYANVQLADYCLRCDGHHVINKRLAIIGHDSAAIWVAVMVFERYHCPIVTILTNGAAATFDEETLSLAKKYNFTIAHSPIKEIIGDPKNQILEGFILENNEKLLAEITFIALGMIVYNELAKMLGANLDQRGFVQTDAKGKSSIDGLYIAGDLRANTKKQIYTAWDTAVDSADEINAILRRKKRQL